MNRTHTLATIAAAQGVQKRAVQNWQSKAVAKYGELGELINGARHFSDEERAQILEFASDRRPAAKATEPATESVAPVEVIEGNHRSALAIPSMPSQVDLGQFRSGDVASFENPLEMIGGAMQLIEAVNGAMTQDLANRIALFNQTQQATVELQRKAAELEAAKTRYQIESDLLGILQNQKTAELGQLMGKVQSLGGAGQSPQ